MLFVGGASFIQLATIGVFSIGAIGIFILNEKNYALGRILSFIDSSGSSASIGYQSNQALIGLKQGGLSGMGIGESIQKYAHCYGRCWKAFSNPDTQFTPPRLIADVD